MPRHPFDTNRILWFGKLFVQQEEFLQECALGHDGTDLEGRLPERCIRVNLIYIGLKRNDLHRLAHGPAANLYEHFGANVWIAVKSRRVFHLDGLGIGCRDRGDIDTHPEGISVDPFLFQLGRKVEL